MELIKSVDAVEEAKKIATTKRETPNVGLDRKIAADLKVREAGKILATDEFEIMGTATAYLYRRRTNDITPGNQNFFVMSSLDLTEIPETFCSHAFNELRSTMMNFYGRKVPRKLKK